MENRITQCTELSEKLYYSIKDAKTYNGIENDIDFVFECALDKNKSIWEYCSDNLYLLASVSTKVQSRIVELMKTGTAHAKFILTCSVQLNPRGVQVGRDFISKIIELAIQDKSKKVKQFGALRANSYDFYEYAALIKLELDKATDSKVIETLSYCYELLTKGYIIDKPDTDTRTWITYNGGGFPLDEEINDPEELHNFILERLKNNPRIQYLYNI